MSQSTAINRAMSAREWALLLALSVLWGGTFFFVAVAVKEIPPLTLVALRVAISALALHAALAILGLRMPRDRRSWIFFLGMGLLNNAGPFALLNWGQSHIPSGIASVLLGTTPFFTAIFAYFVTSDEKLTGGRLFGVMAGMAGIATIVGGAALDVIGTNVAGQLAVIGAAVGYALSALWGRRTSPPGISMLVSATGMLTCSSLVMIPVALAFDQPWAIVAPSTVAWLAVAGLALPSTALAYVLYFRLLATIGATNLMLVTFLMPVTAILLGVVILGERLEARHLLGIALIALGLAAIDGRLWKILSARRT